MLGIVIVLDLKSSIVVALDPSKLSSSICLTIIIKGLCNATDTL